MSVRVPGCAEPLWLRDPASGELACTVIKHSRSHKTARWEEVGLGPYADHCACAAHGSHVDDSGKSLCAPCGVPR